MIMIIINDNYGVQVRD